MSAADALHGLAQLLGTGCGFRRALLLWPHTARGEEARVLDEAACRVRLGTPVAHVLDELASAGVFGAAVAKPLRVAVRVDRFGGCGAVTVLESFARATAARAKRTGAAEAATAGARLSGWMVAVLPLVFSLLVPPAVRSDLDRVDLALFMLGAVSIGIGIRWIARCHPIAPREAPAVAALVEASALIEAGIPLWQALEVVAAFSEWGPLRRAATAYRLGCSWVTALRRVGDPDCDRLAWICDTAHRTGSFAAPSLTRMRADLLDREEQTFEKHLRRAPVVMVLPLVLCILPGFAIMTLGPFLRRLIT